MTKNQKCVVKDSAPHHAGRIGYFQFYGKGESAGTVMLSDYPREGNNCAVYWAVADTDIEEVSL